MAEYTGLEPTDNFADDGNIFENVNFNEAEFDDEYFSTFFASEPQGSNPDLVQQEDIQKAPRQSSPKCIDPKMLSNDYDATEDVASQQQPPANHDTNYLLADPMADYTASPVVNTVVNPMADPTFANGNVFYPVPYPYGPNSAPPMNLPQNAFPYQFMPPTNPGYLGHGAGYPANMYPVYVMPYPPPTSTYPAAAPEALPPNAQPIMQFVPGNDPRHQDMPPAPSFDSSSVDLRLVKGRRSRIPSPIIVYGDPPLKRPLKGPNGEALKNDRIPRVTRKNQPRPNPRDWYGPPLTPPESWGPKDKTGRPLFRYTDYGELERGRTYTQKEMRWYLYGPKVHEKFKLPKPLPNTPRVENKSRQGLTIWIGWVPPQSNDRYPHPSQSQRCRFADCPDPHQTIRTGFPRVIFDERTNLDGDAIDPFFNAGYAHLFCFEKHFDLIQAFHHLDIRPDYRDFKRENNLGKLSRQFPEIHNELDIWWREQHPKFVEHGKNRDRSYEQSLSYRLVCHTLRHSTDGRVKMREVRAGADMSKHKGDLNELLFLKDCMLEGLVDENGDAVPGAREMMEQIRAQGKRKKKGGFKRAGNSKVSAPGGQDPSQTPQSAQSDPYTSGFTPTTDYIPMPQSPEESPAARDVMSTTATNVNQTIVAASMYQPGPDPLDLPRKRSRDVVASEDQQSGYSNDKEQAQEPPSKKRRLSRPASPEPSPPTDQVPLPHDANQQPQTDNIDWSPAGMEEFDGLPSLFSSPGANMDFHDEVDLDDVAAFSLIDAEMPSGKYPTGDNIDKVAETGIDGTFDLELGEGEDLFGELDDADV
ncbi:uncharacterized protein GGS22DRAFT_156229 [Annulohypoxylon maeteangense]|uniref:uncharacterized protein n=1 Tax=Annulohypoxylon maeteangense TaxID=1927788 RepID=UPI002007A338|nr:uncharacterized protein GGS22DRAFT_156229 [Annulohypoxylon maeteangense]KAI0887128.1 hypothetical protein GGS22DRAFT_156229 [Annulohypoxylon maeteangense]